MQLTFFFLLFSGELLVYGCYQIYPECRDCSLCCDCKEEGPNIPFSVNVTEIQ